MMLIESKGQIFMLDRDNQVFQVENLTFWRREDVSQHLSNTLVDGEMVLDIVQGKTYPRYLIYDIILYEVRCVK